MAKTGVYAGHLVVGDIVTAHGHTWRVTRVDHCGNDEVAVVFVTADHTDQLVLNMHPGEILERAV